MSAKDSSGGIDSITQGFSEASAEFNEGLSGTSYAGLTSTTPRLNLRYPLDIGGPTEGHFVRFTVNNVSGAKLESGGRNSPEQNAEGGFLSGILSEIKSSDVGQDVGGFFSSALNSVGGAVNQLKSGVESVTGEVSGAIDQVSSSAGLGNLGTAAVGGLVNQGMGSLGGIVDMPGSIGQIASGITGMMGFKRKSMGHIVLYMPHEVKEEYKANWTASEIGIIGAVALEAGRGLKGGKGGWEVMGRALSTGKEGAVAVGMQKIAGMVGQESLVDLALREGVGTGGAKAAINPHMEQFFKGIEFRDFAFSFDFSPRNQKEAIEVQSIIRAFKYYSAPSHHGKSAYGAFWNYPNEWGIQYWNSDKLHKIKTCACTGVSVDYAGSGVNSTFYDGHPVETKLSLNFVELSQVTKSDFGRGY
jgi:hypothetical protein